MASGVLPVDKIGDLVGLSDLAFARQSLMTTYVGTVTTQADSAQHTDTARAAYGVDGSGIKVGILSDSFNTSGNADTMAVDIAHNDLPAATTVLQDNPGGTDEGRGMAQLVHDLAPGASIEFATAEGGQAAFANNIIALANDGAKVIVDDVGYFAELAFQDGPIAQAVQQVVAGGATYFSSAGNNGHEGWEGAWTSGGTMYGETLMQFAPGQNYLPVLLGASEHFVLEWDQPGSSSGGPGSASDLDLFLTDATGSTVYASATAANIGADPVEVLTFSGGAGVVAYLRVGLSSGTTPGRIKLMSQGSADLATTASNENDGTIYGHAPAGIAVAAASFANTPAFGTNPPTLESFSSTGPTDILFNTSGTRLTTPELRQTPAITAVDGGNTSFFGTDDSSDPDSFPNFYGTSAAAPDAAAVGALMLQANPLLTASDIAFLLQDSSTDMDNPDTAGFDVGFDNGTGSGLIRADLAVGYASGEAIQNPGQQILFGTHLADTVVGAIDADELRGGGGNDVLVGGAGADNLIGGAGTDTADYTGSGAGVRINLATGTGTGGQAQGDRLEEIENLIGSAHDDNLTGDSINNALMGADGNDTLIGGAGNDTLAGGNGGDVLGGGTGIDRAQYIDATAAVVADLALPGNNTGFAAGDTYFSIENLFGGNFDDTLRGDSIANSIWGADGNDIVFGRSGNDSLYGMDGNDTLVGGAGGDLLNGGSGTDRAQYNDATAGLTVDLQTPGDNTGIAAGDSYVSIEDVYGSNFADTLRGDSVSNSLFGVNGNDVIFGRDGNDSLFGTNGNDTLVGGAGGDLLSGGTGTDRAQYNDATAGLTVDLETPGNNTGIAAGDSYVSIEDLFGGNFSDNLRGNVLANSIWGGNGNDVIYGRDGNDTLNGGNGNDTLIGQVGRDFLYGNGGNDTFQFLDPTDSSADALRDHIQDFSKGADVIDLSHIDAKTTTAGNQAFSFIGAANFHGVAGELHAVNSSGNALVEGDVNGDGHPDFSIVVVGVTNLHASDFLL